MANRSRASRRSGASGRDPFAAPSHDRKDLQLCRQVADTLHSVLGDCGDDCLRDLHVVRVVPAPDASQLLVIVGSPPGETPAEPRAVLERLNVYLLCDPALGNWFQSLGAPHVLLRPDRYVAAIAHSADEVASWPIDDWGYSLR